MVENTPAEPLPRLDSMRSGASSEFRNWLPFCAIWVNDFRSKFDLDAGLFFEGLGRATPSLGLGLRRPLRSTRTTGCPAFPRPGRYRCRMRRGEVSDSAAMAKARPVPRSTSHRHSSFPSLSARPAGTAPHLVVLKRFDDARAIPRCRFAFARFRPACSFVRFLRETVISSLKRFDYPYGKLRFTSPSCAILVRSLPPSGNRRKIYIVPPDPASATESAALHRGFDERSTEPLMSVCSSMAETKQVHWLRRTAPPA